MSDIKKSNLYTRTGDKGTTQEYGGTRLQKSHPIFDSVGKGDSLMSKIGIANYYIQDQNINDQLIEIQSRLFDINAQIATLPGSSDKKLARVEFDPNNVINLENWIDYYDDKVPQLTNFLLPGGNIQSLKLNECRCATREMERKVVNCDHVSQEVKEYLNRLSDYFFAVSRYVNLGNQEVYYKKGVGLKEIEPISDLTSGPNSIMILMYFLVPIVILILAVLFR